YFNLIKDRLEQIGYTVYARIVNAADYGIPQLRCRLIIVGVRSDVRKKYVFPKATHGIDSKNHLDYVAIEEVIESLAPPSPKYYFSERAVQGVKNAKPNMKRALAQDIKKPCLTITSHLAKVSLNSRDPVLLVDQQRELYRRFTPLEAARIQSFPDSFIFCGSEGDAYRQIGNAIPPVLFWHVTRSVIKQLFNNRK
ncbi:MAG: DNA (cytosine-5-)-methyltransferase, partial [Candidatus Omnitrophota bacterium]